MLMYEIWSLGKKPFSQLSPPEVHCIIIYHGIAICVCSLLEVCSPQNAYEVCQKSTYINYICILLGHTYKNAGASLVTDVSKIVDGVYTLL